MAWIRWQSFLSFHLSTCRTLSVVMSSLIYNPDMIWGMVMSAVFLTLIPSLILAIVVWKFVVENIILGASKY